MADMESAVGSQHGALRVRSALFVDFENIHLGLQRLDPTAANRFAVNPQGWLAWLERLSYPALGTADIRRDLLIRYCYLNPVSSARYRAYFTRAGFHVVDCPPLTAAGKNSADIHIVIDVLDILGHPTRFDEVILLSADADYTPVMLRLRAHDRRTVIITSGPSARAFRAACDHVVGEDAFIDDALTIEARPYTAPGNGPGAATSSPLSVPSAMTGPQLAPSHDGTALTGPMDLASPAPGPPTAVPRLPPYVFYPAAGAAANGAESHDEYLRAAIAAQVKDLVTASDRPITLAAAAQLVRSQLGADVTDGWAGTGSFKKLLTLVDLPGLEISAAPEYIYDPCRHSPPPGTVNGNGQTDTGGPQAEVVNRISQVTDIPRLTSQEFRALFDELAGEVASHGFNRTGTSRAVRDRCVARGEHVGRGAVNFVLNGLLYAGRPPQPGDDARTLAHAFADNAVLLCQNARMELSADEIALLRGWITGEVSTLVEAGAGATAEAALDTGNGQE